MRDMDTLTKEFELIYSSHANVACIPYVFAVLGESAGVDMVDRGRLIVHFLLAQFEKARPLERTALEIGGPC